MRLQQPIFHMTQRVSGQQPIPTRLRFAAEPTGSEPEPPASRPHTFAEFWPTYLQAHSRPVTRAVHYTGTATGLLLLGVTAITGNLWFLPAAAVASYGVMFASHGLFERNKPKSFTNPLWSIGGDLKMSWLALTGRLKDELKKHDLEGK